MRRFPIMGRDRDRPIKSIPWAMIAPHEAQAIRNHSQSLERLAQRGGLDVFEAVWVLEGKGWNADPELLSARDITDEQRARYQERLQELVDDWDRRTDRSE